MKKNFCEINPLFYTLSKQKNIFTRKAKDLFSKEKFAKTKLLQHLPVVAFSFQTVMLKKGKDINPLTQENKVINIKIAAQEISEVVVRKGETFSFWHLVGKTTKRKGYKAGRILKNNRLIAGTGGGLCNLANAVNNLILHSPLQITEFHKHTDALACDIENRIPMANGTSVSYNYIDYRFKNTTDQDVQIVLWTDSENLYGQLLSQREFAYTYNIIEDDHHFEKQNGKIYRVSKIYKQTIEKRTGLEIAKELIWDNHSEVMFDYNLIPKELLR